ncbi:MAG TPA: response regulator [Candidatus Thermoplasmatota archaeon]|nr:response regulator [Candidatus Thermoplasmatota archaeon]
MIEILLVDDSAIDVQLMQEALEGSLVSSRLHSARDGIEAMAFLRQEAPFEDAPRPSLILLDLKLPRKGGLEVLAEIKGDATLRGIPTVMLTSSSEERDIARAYDLQANGYVQKPVDFDEFIAVMGAIEQFWTGVARLPSPLVA